MQTFLPYANFQDSAQVLDRQRLGKQRVEAKQILRALLGETAGWVNHPATKMWRGHERALAGYGMVICAEWRARGYRDTLLEYFRDQFLSIQQPFTLPRWYGNIEFHRSHQSNLLRKDPDYYGDIFISVPNDLPYVWLFDEES